MNYESYFNTETDLFSGTRIINNYIKNIVKSIFLINYYFLCLFFTQTKSFNILFNFMNFFNKFFNPESIIFFPFLYCLSILPKDYKIYYKTNYKEFRLNRKNCNETIFYVHGGGFISGDFGGYGDFCNLLREKFRRNVVFPQYRLGNLEHIL